MPQLIGRSLSESFARDLAYKLNNFQLLASGQWEVESRVGRFDEFSEPDYEKPSCSGGEGEAPAGNLTPRSPQPEIVWSFPPTPPSEGEECESEEVSEDEEETPAEPTGDQYEEQEERDSEEQGQREEQEEEEGEQEEQEQVTDSQPEPPRAPTPRIYPHSPDYFLPDDPMVIFLVEDKLYKFHRHFFIRESQFFEGMFMCPPAESTEGLTEATAIAVPDVTAHEMTCLLKFFYHGMFDPKFDSIEDLKGLLSITTRFVFSKVRDEAIKQIDDHPAHIPPAEKIVLARKNEVQHWLLPAFVELCLREEDPDLDEMEMLNADTTIKLLQARGRLLRETFPQKSLIGLEENCSSGKANSKNLCVCCKHARQLEKSLSPTAMQKRAEVIVESIFGPSGEGA